MSKVIWMSQLAENILSKPPAKGMKTKIIAIDGGTGFSHDRIGATIANGWKNCGLINTHEFATPDDPIDWASRLIRQVLVPLSTTTRCRFQSYDWNKRNLEYWREFDSVDVVILQGLGSLQEKLRPFVSYGIFVEAERQFDSQDLVALDWFRSEKEATAWLQGRKRYLDQEQPEKRANVVVLDDPESKLDLEEIRIKP